MAPLPALSQRRLDAMLCRGPREHRGRGMTLSRLNPLAMFEVVANRARHARGQLLYGFGAVLQEAQPEKCEEHACGNYRSVSQRLSVGLHDCNSTERFGGRLS